MKTNEKQQQLQTLAAQLRKNADNITEQNKAEVWENFKQVFKIYTEVTTDYLLEMKARIEK